MGIKARNPRTICKSDCAKELLKAIRSLGWLSDASLPRRWPHNSVLERQIRSFEESCRSMHLQAGFAVFPKLWTLTCQYTAVSMSIGHWSKAFGSEFKGADYILGQLVFYRTKFQEKSKLAPNSSPALMGGWKLEFGRRYKGVLRLVDYNSLKQGHVSIVVAPDQEVYVLDERVFPLRDLAEKALNVDSDPLFVNNPWAKGEKKEARENRSKQLSETPPARLQKSKSIDEREASFRSGRSRGRHHKHRESSSSSSSARSSSDSDSEDRRKKKKKKKRKKHGKPPDHSEDAYFRWCSETLQGVPTSSRALCQVSGEDWHWSCTSTQPHRRGLADDKESQCQKIERQRRGRFAS